MVSGVGFQVSETQELTPLAQTWLCKYHAEVAKYALSIDNCFKDDSSCQGGLTPETY